MQAAMLDLDWKKLITNERSYKGYFRQICYHLCYLKMFLVPETKKENIADTICMITNYYRLLLLRILFRR